MWSHHSLPRHCSAAPGHHHCVLVGGDDDDDDEDDDDDGEAFDADDGLHDDENE